MNLLSITLIVLVVLAGAITIAVSLWTGSPPVPTSPRVLAPILVLSRRVPRREILDLGSGFGTLLFSTARMHPRARVIGYEISPIPYLFSWIRLAISRLENVELRFQTYWEADLATADLVLCYLGRSSMMRLVRKLEDELPFGAEVISQTFSLPGWTPKEVLVSGDLYKSPVYRYSRPKPEPVSIRHPWLERPPSAPSKSRAFLNEAPPDPDET